MTLFYRADRFPRAAKIVFTPPSIFPRIPGPAAENPFGRREREGGREKSRWRPPIAPSAIVLILTLLLYTTFCIARSAALPPPHTRLAKALHLIQFQRFWVSCLAHRRASASSWLLAARRGAEGWRPWPRLVVVELPPKPISRACLTMRSVCWLNTRRPWRAISLSSWDGALGCLVLAWSRS